MNSIEHSKTIEDRQSLSERVEGSSEVFDLTLGNKNTFG